MSTVSAAVRVLEPAMRSTAERWAQRLGLPLESEASQMSQADVALEVGAAGLALRPAGGSPVRVVPGAILVRPKGGRDNLLRAVGPLTPNAAVADATAGLGVDGWRLAARGAEVTMIERVPLIAALLEDALARAREGREGEEARRAGERVRLLVGDACELLAGLRPAPAVVLIDPMYPPSAKRALPKKGMALFRDLVGGDEDAPELLAAALEVATARVVVKRPRRAPGLGEGTGLPRPSGSVLGTTTRYDLYAPRGRAS